MEETEAREVAAEDWPATQSAVSMGVIEDGRSVVIEAVSSTS